MELLPLLCCAPRKRLRAKQGARTGGCSTERTSAGGAAVAGLRWNFMPIHAKLAVFPLLQGVSGQRLAVLLAPTALGRMFRAKLGCASSTAGCERAAAQVLLAPSCISETFMCCRHRVALLCRTSAGSGWRCCWRRARTS